MSNTEVVLIVVVAIIFSAAMGEEHGAGMVIFVLALVGIIFGIYKIRNQIRLSKSGKYEVPVLITGRQNIMAHINYSVAANYSDVIYLGKKNDSHDIRDALTADEWSDVQEQIREFTGKL